MLLEQADGSSAVLYVSLLARRSPDLEILGDRGRIRIEAPLFRPAALTLWDAGRRIRRHAEYPIGGQRLRLPAARSGRGTPRRPARERRSCRSTRPSRSCAPWTRCASRSACVIPTRAISGSLEEPDHVRRPDHRLQQRLGRGCGARLRACRRHGLRIDARYRQGGRLCDAAAKATALEIRIVALDVTRPETFAARSMSIVADYGRLDVLVNNAGVLRAGALRGSRRARASRGHGDQFLRRPFSSARAVLPQMRRQRAAASS